MRQDDGIQEVLQEATDTGHVLEIVEKIRSGKEATVYRVIFDGTVLAMKVYTDPERRDFGNADSYLQNKFYKYGSHARAVAKGGKFGKRLRHDNWIKREFYLLKKLYALGATIPKPVAHIGDAILMDFVGDNRAAAPQLSEVRLTDEEARLAFHDIMQSVEIFWLAGAVHADLSAYNILWWRGRSVIIDFPQSVDTRTHPDAKALLERDVRNMAQYFKKYFDVDCDEILDRFDSSCT